VDEDTQLRFPEPILHHNENPPVYCFLFICVFCFSVYSDARYSRTLIPLLTGGAHHESTADSAACEHVCLLILHNTEYCLI
jgi:hypothetical protein